MNKIETGVPEQQSSTSRIISIPLLINTVFAVSSEPRNVTVNVTRIEESLKSLAINRRLQQMGIG